MSAEVHFYAAAVLERVGGALLQSMRLTRAMFGARAMVAVRVRLAKMKLKELAEELGARGATKSGRKRALQLRLRALIIRAAHSS